LYFSEYRQWSPLEKRAIKLARGRILDVGCGAGRHALYLQSKNFDVTGIDNSPGAIKVCKLRGLTKAIVRPISEVDKFKPASFDTILMMGTISVYSAAGKTPERFSKNSPASPRPMHESSPKLSTHT